MEEYTQLTLDDWVSFMEALGQDIAFTQTCLTGAKQGFNRIGYKLRIVRDEKLYEREGCKTVAEFAEKKYGLKDFDVSKCIRINEKYSVGGYSEELRPEFLEYGKDKLSAMLALPDSDLELITPKTSRESIRELNRFNKQQEPEELTPLQGVIESFYKDNKEILNELYDGDAFREKDIKEMVEIINPSGNRTYRKGTFFLFFYGAETGIKIKEFKTKDLQEMTWEEFFDRTKELFGEEPCEDAYEAYFGQETTEKEPEEKVAPAQVDRVNTRAEADFEEPENEGVPEEIGNGHQVIGHGTPTKQTKEQKYAAEQRKIDKETKEKLEEREQEEKMAHLPSETKTVSVHEIRLAAGDYDDVLTGRKSFELRKYDADYREGDELLMQEYKNGEATGREIRASIEYLLSEHSGLTEGYCLLGIVVIKEGADE